MKIGVIGIGEMGGTLARRWSANGHRVRVANSRGPGTVRQFADEIGAEAADIYGAMEGAEVVLLSIPFPVVATLPHDLFDRAAPAGARGAAADRQMCALGLWWGVGVLMAGALPP